MSQCPMTMDQIGFRPLQRRDTAALCAWLNAPHVAAWWGVGAAPDGIGGRGDDAATAEQVSAEYGASMDGLDSTHRFVILVDDQPVGLIQWYRLSDSEDYAAAIGERDGAGIDLLIGVAAHLGRGLGGRVIDRFVTDVVFADADADAGVDRVVAGPDVRNHRSIRAFEHAGFTWARDATVDGEPAPEHIMVRARDGAPSQ